jgi:2-polyprenyl-3-methyl-5-hydroxy-6-metoxy-1,4-benzoquinol methylase
MSEADARYDDVAGFYVEQFDDVHGDPATVAVLDLVGDVNGRNVLDLACGHGRLSRELARRGAVVTAADVSAELLNWALEREKSDGLGIRYVHIDASATDVLWGETYDVVTCNWGLSDIDDLAGVVRTVARVLAPRGAFVFSILHPCFAGGEDVSASWPREGGYFREGWWRADGASSGLRRQVGSFHRMLSTYLNTITLAGLSVDIAREPAPPQRHGATDVGPVYFVARCSRRAASRPMS